MSRLLVRNVLLDGEVTDVRVEDNRITAIGQHASIPEQLLEGDADVVLDAAARQAIIPPFYNAHTHAAMTLLRGYAEDLELANWLGDHIWPAEAQLTEEDIYAGSRLAILEMIKSGTVFFNDMYWEQTATLRAAEEMGVRAEIGLLHITGPAGQPNPRSQASNAELLAAEPGTSDRISIAHAPHSVYAVDQATLTRVAADVAESGRRVHIHASETAEEVRDCLALHGLTPIGYLDSLGLLGPGTILAHCVHLTDDDRALIAERQAVIAHMAVSNLKLCSGFFHHQQAHRAGCRIVLGTDGAASNNSLSMFGEMKTAALLAKAQAGSPLAGKDHAIYRAATRDSALAFGIDAGVIEEGRVADFLLVDLDNPTMVSDHSLTANLVYSADPSVVNTVVCDGRVLMRDRVVADEAEIIERGREASRRVAQRR
ncbi:MAG: amidohydrolase [Actinobacteria bacterium]|nr:amidohydrolase [Actinomycetota bacterium]MCB9412457.1 amidohydrolase [Actinomycetota bacterium]